MHLIVKRWKPRFVNLYVWDESTRVGCLREVVEMWCVLWVEKLPSNVTG